MSSGSRIVMNSLRENYKEPIRSLVVLKRTVKMKLSMKGPIVDGDINT